MTVTLIYQNDNALVIRTLSKVQRNELSDESISDEGS